MPDILESVFQRPVIIALAIAGAVIATVGSYLLRKEKLIDPRVARFVLRFGYGLTWVSVGIFIAIGLLGDRL